MKTPFSKTALIGVMVVASAMFTFPQNAPDPSGINSGVTPANTEYKFSKVNVIGIAYPVDVWADVWYPQGLAGGPYPLVIILHGNHGICRVPGTMTDICSASPPDCPGGMIPTPNHEGYDYIAQRLVTWGYIVASINANAINCRANGYKERGQLVIEHLQRWKGWNSAAGAPPFGTQFSGKVDLTRVSVFGHSRGGEGVRAAYNINVSLGATAPATIIGVSELAPTDACREGCGGPATYNAYNVNFSVLLPACDGDVSDNEGMRVFDRAQQNKDTTLLPKAQQFVWGANHNFLNSQWATDDANCMGDQTAITRPGEQNVGEVYVMGFVRNYVGGENFKAVFTGDLLPPVPVDAITRVFNGYNESRPATLLIDDFTNARSPNVNTNGGANTAVNIAITSCASTGGGATHCDTPSTATNASSNVWQHDAPAPAPAPFFKHAGKIVWPNAGVGVPSFALQLAAGGKAVDVSGYNNLSFRTAEQNDTTNNPAYPGTQDFQIQLTDGKGNTQTALAATGFRRIFPPQGSGDLKSVLSTIRIPLASYDKIQLNQVTLITFIFNQQAKGAIFLGDIHFEQ